MNIGKYLQMYSEDLRLKNYCDRTIENYISQVKCFLEHFNSVATKPSEINERQIKTWLLESKSINGRRHRLSAIKLFYSLTGRQPLKFKYIEYPRKENKVPVILSVDEVRSMFKVCENKKHKAILALLYSCGLRVSELLNLKWDNIKRDEKVIYIIQAKGKKDRMVSLDKNIIPILEEYYKQYKPKVYVFNGWKDSLRYTETSVREVVKQIAEKAGIKKKVWTHLMRHNCFTHMVENGTDINIIQKIAGHSSVKTTQMYIQMSNTIISKIPTPLGNVI